jgi:peroxiredoxin
MPLINTARYVTTYSVCIVLLLISNGVMLWKHVHLRNEIGKSRSARANALGIEALMSQPLPTSNGESIILAHTPSQYVVLFVFTPSDCSPCLAELTTLNKLEQLRSDMKVFGLMSYANLDEMRQTQQNFGVSYPILQDHGGQILGSLGLPKTPWKVVVDVSTKHIIYEDRPSLSDAEREAFINRLVLLGG